MKSLPLYGKEMSTPVGKLLLLAEDTALVGIVWENLISTDRFLSESNTILEAAHTQLNEYFSGMRNRFDLPVSYTGTTLQQSVWKALEKIPYGTTITYASLAKKIGHRSAVRAVASAVGKNPLPILLPCHRVIGTDGTLRGFAGGLHHKEILLTFEARHISQ